MKKILILILAISFTALLSAQTGVTIPYEMVGGKMRIKIKVNGTSRYFVFDTGGQTTITKRLQEELSLAVYDSIKVTDATSVNRFYRRYLIDDMTFESGGYGFKSVPAIVIDGDNRIFDCFGAAGIIGNDVISRFILEIDSRKKEIKLLPPHSKITVSLRNMVKFDNNRHKMPVFSLSVAGGETLQVLFDTGSGSFLSVKSSDYQLLANTPAVVLKSEGLSRSSMSISGELNTSVVRNVELPLVAIGMARFTDVETNTSESPYTLLGSKLLEYGKITVDYPRSRFYFEPFFKEAVKITNKSWSIGFSANADGQLVISSLDNEMKDVGIGDRILKIDGIEVPHVDFCESIINGVELLKGKDKCELTVEHDGTQKNIIITRK